MKKNSVTKFAILLLALTMIAVMLVSGTYAKYTSTTNYTDTAVVARWNVSSAVASGSHDIFAESEIYDTNGVSDFTVAGTVDTDVKNATTGNNAIIAPGTWGKMSFELTNDSDVNATYAVAFTITNESNVPLQWSSDGTNWSSTLTDITSTAIAMNGNATVNVYWKWVFDGNDSTDTGLGTAVTLPTVTLAYTATFTQVD